jgi:hypothetical protein
MHFSSSLQASKSCVHVWADDDDDDDDNSIISSISNILEDRMNFLSLTEPNPTDGLG